MKKIIVKPADEILLKVSDEEEYVLTFNTKCLMYVQDAVQDIQGESSINKENYSEILPLILYGSINAKEEKISIEDARELGNQMSTTTGIAIINAFTESLAADLGTLPDAQKKRIAKAIKNLMK